MKTLYLDIFSGISGDMFLGALIDLGVDFPKLQEALGSLPLGGYHLHVSRGQKSGIEGVKFEVHWEHGDIRHEHPEFPQEHQHRRARHHGRRAHEHPDEHSGAEAGSHDHEDAHEEDGGEHHAHEGSRDFAQIKELIRNSSLSAWVKEKAVAVFQRIAVAEGRIHGRPPERVHFHEVGAVDSIVDIVGGCIGLEMLGRPAVLAAPVVEGTGWVDCAHGRFPVPTAATLEILGARGIPLTQCDEPHELVTPTGAALLAEFVEGFGPMRRLTAMRIGYGLGGRDHKTRPNVLRAILSEARAPSHAMGAVQANDWETDTVCVLETNLDDASAEVLGYFVEQTLAAGALDVFHTPVQMKKNRPGVLLTVLCGADDADRFTEMMLRETSAFGVRRHAAERRKLMRESTTVPTPYGEITVKLGKLNGRILHATPEFESCKRAAAAAQAPLQEIYEAARRAFANRVALQHPL